MSTSTAETTLTLESCVVRDTASKKGRTRTVSPAKTSAKHLHYGRIILDAGDAPLSIETGGHETGFIVLGGSATIGNGVTLAVQRPLTISTGNLTVNGAFRFDQGGTVSGGSAWVYETITRLSCLPTSGKIRMSTRPAPVHSASAGSRRL